MLRVMVLGPVSAERNGESLDLGGPTQRRLLATLVARHDETVSVAELLTALWGDDPPPSGPGSIQAYISRLRRVLGPDVIETAAPGYRFNTSLARVDAIELTDAVSNLPEDRADRILAIRGALELWSGVPFEDISALEGMARRLIEARVVLEEQLAKDLVEAGHSAESVGVLERVTSVEPLRERTWIQLGQTLANSGRNAEAVRAMSRYRETVAEYGLEPSVEFTAVENKLFEQASKPDRRQRVSVPTTSFVGRDSERDRLAQLISDGRLTSLIGPGGMGKTRLALEVLAGVESANVWLAQLAATSESSGVAPSVLRSLGIESRGDPVAAVLRALEADDIVFLDNCEHVIEGAASLAAAIAADTDARVVTTSREPLNVSGETIVMLGPLDRSSARRLYEERAQAINPEFSGSNRQIDRLCEMLDFMPLAIEIAASRSLALNPEEIADNLDHEYSILARPRRGGEARHETLHSLVRWSYELMPAKARRLFERLALFAGRFDHEAIEAVAGFGELAGQPLHMLLADLVERSMLTRHSDGTFRLLRVLKSFAMGQLVDAGDRETAADLHSAHFSALAPDIGAGIASADELEWLGIANQAVEDIGLALEWAIGNGDLERCRRILEGLFDWFYHRQPPELMSWGDRVLAIADGHPVFPVASAWSALASIKRNDIDQAWETAQNGIAFGEHPATRFAWFMAGDVACYTGELDFARTAFGHQLVRASKEGDQIGVIDAIGGEVLALSYQGAYEEAYAVAQGIEPAANATGSPTYIAFAQYTLGESLVESDPDQAKKHLQTAVETAASVNNKLIEGMARTAMGPLLANNGDLDEANSQMIQALEVYLDLGANAYAWTALRYLALIGARVGETGIVAQIIAATESNGRRPYGIEEEEWDTVKERLTRQPEHAQWWESGSKMTLEEVSGLAIDELA